MCGILGFTHVNRPLPPGVLDRALDGLVHRGPDHQGSFASEHVSLGAARLRIQDLESGDQPLISPDGEIVIVFNGEIYNQRELRRELEAHGYSFETHCDTEVVLYAFMHWGNECFARLRGMFGVALWNQSENRLVLARDRMGIKPVYYCQHEGEILFGSELKCIFSHPGVRRRVSLDGLNSYLNLNWVPGPQTLAEGIMKLMPGHLLEWQGGRCTEHSYLPDTAPAPTPTSVEEACEQLDFLLQQAVSEQLLSDVPVGIWLSGGLDSSTILRYATGYYPGKLRTFSVTFKGRTFDESAAIAQISRHFGSEHTEFNLDESADLIAAIERMAYYSDEPSADAGALPAWFLAEMTRKDVTVVLTGEGSDELFAGYLTYKADRYAAAARRIPAFLRRGALAVASRLPVSDEKISFEYKLKRFLQGSLLSPEQAHVFWNGTFTESEKREFFPHADSAPLARALAWMNGAQGLQPFLHFDQRYYLPDDILYKVDRMSMAHSLEVRPPFLDTRIVDFAAALPENYKLRGSSSKYVLRQLMKDKLPPEILRRPKIGFDIPVHEWLRGPLQPLLLDTLSEQAVRAAGLFHWPAIERLIRNHLERKANLGYHLWGLMVLSMWMKEWKIEAFSESSTRTLSRAAAADRVGSF